MSVFENWLLIRLFINKVSYGVQTLYGYWLCIVNTASKSGVVQNYEKLGEKTYRVLEKFKL